MTRRALHQIDKGELQTDLLKSFQGRDHAPWSDEEASERCHL